jgi:hypothetical protein
MNALMGNKAVLLIFRSIDINALTGNAQNHVVRSIFFKLRIIIVRFLAATSRYICKPAVRLILFPLLLFMSLNFSLVITTKLNLFG